uniref:Uncharacterized protein n=1 Tax=Cajanus cajan TaxID=3821 RepID=A0A151U1T4_CAJCA|nr:hypothetical protein KK1_005866 [Cajanus cajan]
MVNNVHVPTLFVLPSTPLPSSPLTPTPSIPIKLDVFLNKPNRQVQPQPTIIVPTKRPRGRPLGSKNKPKPIMDIFKLTILFVPASINIVDDIIDFSRKLDVSIVVHHASGTISKINILKLLSPSNCLSFQENLHMLSLSGFYTKNLSPSPLRTFIFPSSTFKS